MLPLPLRGNVPNHNAQQQSNPETAINTGSVHQNGHSFSAAPATCADELTLVVVCSRDALKKSLEGVIADIEDRKEAPGVALGS